MTQMGSHSAGLPDACDSWILRGTGTVHTWRWQRFEGRNERQQRLQQQVLLSGRSQPPHGKSAGSGHRQWPGTARRQQRSVGRLDQQPSSGWTAACGHSCLLWSPPALIPTPRGRYHHHCRLLCSAVARQPAGAIVCDWIMCWHQHIIARYDVTAR